MKQPHEYPLQTITIAFLLFTGVLALLFALGQVVTPLGTHLTEVYALLFLFTPMAYFRITKEREFIRFGLLKPGLLWGAGAAVILLGGYALLYWLYLSYSCQAGIGTSLGRLCSHYSTTFSFPMGLGRTLHLLLVHTIAVALPEEYFYRGFLLELLRRSVSFKKLSLRSATLLALTLQALFFALGHALVDGNPLRMAVFFPALIFGILALRSQTLLAPILFHGLANTVSEILERGWFHS